MKRILFLLFAVGLTANMTVMAGMSTSKVRKETRFLTDKMAYELSLSTQQYNDAYEINYDFIYSVRNIMDYVARGYEWALDDYYEALDIRNDDLRWILSDAQYRRFLGAEYFYRPIYVTGGKWSFRVYINYPNRSLFYFGVPYIRRLHQQCKLQGYTLVPLSLYFKHGRVKMELGLCKGKKLYDKRADAAQRDAKRSIDCAMKSNGKYY